MVRPAAAVEARADASSPRAVTYRHERWRAVAAGVIETAGSTFLLLIALRFFNAGALAKGLVAAGSSVGMLLTPFTVSTVTAWGWAPSRAAACLLLAGAAAMLAAAATPWLGLFVAGAILGMASASCVIPLLTHMYEENYPEHERGKLFSRTMMIRIATTIAFGSVAGWLLGRGSPWHRVLVVVFAAALFLAAWCLRRCPTRPIHQDGGTHPLRALRFVAEDELFRRTLICWMLMGFANLMMLPLRVEYLGNPRYGLHLSPPDIALYTVMIPNVARLALSPVWGWLFDRMNFFTLRVAMNAGFAAGILTFFVSDSPLGLVLGAIVYGISNAGGDVAWSLWVTKFAPPGRVADYMSVHTFLTGIRGVLAPLVGFYVVTRFPLWQLGIASAVLIVAGTSLLLPEVRLHRPGRRAPALTDESPE